MLGRIPSHPGPRGPQAVGWTPRSCRLLIMFPNYEVEVLRARNEYFSFYVSLSVIVAIVISEPPLLADNDGAIVKHGPAPFSSVTTGQRGPFCWSQAKHTASSSGVRL